MPGELIRRIIITGMPLMINEVIWSLGMTFINQSYSSRGLAAVAAINITATAWNLFCVIMFAMGNAVAILVGQRLGAGDKDGARDVDRKLIFLSTVIHVAMGILLILCSDLIPLLYNIEPSVRELTAKLLRVAGMSLPIHAFSHVVYFTIRSGGKTGITFLFDAVYTWVVPVTLAYALCHFTQLPILWVYFAVQFIDVVKVIIGALMLRSDFWANNVVDASRQITRRRRGLPFQSANLGVSKATQRPPDPIAVREPAGPPTPSRAFFTVCAAFAGIGFFFAYHNRRNPSR